MGGGGNSSAMRSWLVSPHEPNSTKREPSGLGRGGSVLGAYLQGGCRAVAERFTVFRYGVASQGSEE